MSAIVSRKTSLLSAAALIGAAGLALVAVPAKAKDKITISLIQVLTVEEWPQEMAAGARAAAADIGSDKLELRLLGTAGADVQKEGQIAMSEAAPTFNPLSPTASQYILCWGDCNFYHIAEVTDGGSQDAPQMQILYERYADTHERAHDPRLDQGPPGIGLAQVRVRLAPGIPGVAVAQALADPLDDLDELHAR